MENRTGRQFGAPRLEVIPGGGEKAEKAGMLSNADSGIVCHYGVAVRYTSFDGLELVEFEFLSEAA